MVKGKSSDVKNENNEVNIDIGESEISNGKTADMGHDKEECLKTVSLKENDGKNNENEKEKENNNDKEKEKRVTSLTVETAKEMESGISQNQETSSPKKKKHMTLPAINTSLASPTNEIIPPSPSVLAVETGGLVSWTIASPAVYECKDEDVTKKEWIKRKFSMLTPSTRTSFIKPKNNTNLGNIPENNELPSDSDQQQSEQQNGEPRKEQPTVEHTEITNIPVGTVTQFAKPVPQDQVLKIVPPTIKGRRRSLSYLNTLSATPKSSCSLREWLVYMKKESIKLNEEGGDENNDYDKIDIGKDNPKEEDISNTEPKTEEEVKDNSSDISDIDLEMYDAILFATDDDFLEKSKIRAIFKKNAIQPDDAKLFEMPEYKGPTNNEEGQLLLYEDATLCDICFPEPPQNVTGIKAFIFQYRYIMISIIIIAVFVPIFLFKSN